MTDAPTDQPADVPSEGPSSGTMVRWRAARVERLLRRWRGCVELEAVLDRPIDDRSVVRALAYPALVGDPVVGDHVLLTTGALERGLGTGGYAVVAALPDRLPEPAAPASAGGHLVKARYTPLQAMVLGADEQDSPHHAALRDADDLGGLPVVVADLHSALPAVVAGVRSVRPGARVAYVMTDGGALPAWFSRTLDGLREASWLVGCVTVG
ncbi:MAG TPA: DUF3866 family protein, partial [Angustibacter sp.]|nr:DUF3866 family protein [Angustibacter sp.]